MRFILHLIGFDVYFWSHKLYIVCRYILRTYHMMNNVKKKYLIIVIFIEEMNVSI